MLNHVSPGCVQHQVALSIKRQVLGTPEGKPDDTRIGAGSNHEVVLQLPLVAVVDEIDAWVDIPVRDLAIRRDVRSPPTGIIAYEIVDSAWQLLFAHNTRAGIR